MSKIDKFGKYRLCRVEVESKSSLMLLDENGKDICATPMEVFENNEDYYYAIYENMGDEQFEEWSEYEYFEDDKERAMEEFNKLIKKGE